MQSRSRPESGERARSGGQRVSERTLVRVQAGSGLLFAIFVVAHLLGTLLAPFGAATYDGVQSTLRAVYQEPWVEISLLLGSFLVHIVSGAIRARRRPKRRPGPSRWQRRSGWLLVLIVLGHTLATRGPSLAYGIWPGFEGVAFSLHWFPSYFYPYYLLISLAAAYHGGLGILRAVRVFGLRPRTSVGAGGRGRFGLGRRGWVALSAFGVLLLVALLAFGGVFFEVENPLNNPYAHLYTGGES